MISKKRIAIIGSGISGLSAAYFLHKTHKVTLFEKNNYFGGHSRTISFNSSGDEGESKIDVDTGFIVFNDRNYPNLVKFFNELGIKEEKTEMSFSFSCPKNNLEWSGTNLGTIFAQRKNLLNIKMIRGLRDIFKFNRLAIQEIQKSPEMSYMTLGDFLKHLRLGNWFNEFYLLPMGSAIWSCSPEQMLDFPAITFLKFFDNHGLLSIANRPQWCTLTHKSASYINAIRTTIGDSVTFIKNSSLQKINRTDEGIQIRGAENKLHTFDQIIFACHPTQILKMIDHLDAEEARVLSKFSIQLNHVYTHCDAKFMPSHRKCWASWNFIQGGSYNDGENQIPKSCVTYWMNHLQHIKSSSPIFVTLNPFEAIQDRLIYDYHTFDHPLFDQRVIQAQQEIEGLQGHNNTWYCGAYLRYGFHEDGIWSTLQMLSKMKEPLPW